MVVIASLLLNFSLVWGAGSSWAGLSAAAGKVDITPDLSQGHTYMAGFGASGRKPQGVHDPLYARIVLLSNGEKTVALVGLDIIGYYFNDAQDLRRISGFDAPNHYLFVAATHDHSGPDTVGLWGPFIGISGVNKTYQRFIKDQVSEKIKELSAQLEPVSLSGAEESVDARGLCRDSRDPVVINPFLEVLSFRGKDKKTLATIVNWSCHAEALGPKNKLITADFPGYLCQEIEDKTHGQCLFLNGTIGGLLTPDEIAGHDEFSESKRIGTAVADHALEALSRAKTAGPNPRLDFKSREILIPIENSRYLLMLPELTFGHHLFDARGNLLPNWKAYSLALWHALHLLRPADSPWAKTEVSLVTLGPALILGIPGEIFSELVVGGYDGRYTFGHPLIKPANPNPPEVASAPKGPYLRDEIHSPIKMVVGLANDELGYIIPGYDFKVQPTLLMLPRLPGDHYEETNSIGPSATGIIVNTAEELLK